LTPTQEGGGGFLALVRQDFTVGKPTGVVDADMQALPTDPVMSIDRAGAASGNAMADAGDTPELLGVEVQQLARVRPLVAYDRYRRVERREPIEAKPAQDFGHCRDEGADGRDALLDKDPAESRHRDGTLRAGLQPDAGDEYRELGMPSCRAIAGELIRCRRSRSMSVMRSAGVPRIRAGLELRSSSAVSPPACQRRTHLLTVCSLTQKSAATLTALAPAPTRRAISSRLYGVSARILVDVHPGLGSGC
jgi:hypothetical protein